MPWIAFWHWCNDFSSMLRSILKFLFYLLIFGLLSAGVIAGFLFFQRPLEEALIVLAVLFGSTITIVLVRKLIIRMRARAQVKRILQQEQALPIDEEQALTPEQLEKDLRKGWKQALAALKKSQLRVHGDPLYVLPWYMIIGRPRSGKSTAMRNARLLLPEIELPEHADGSTLNLEWWLYDQAIVIDTAGRYAVPEESRRDRKEWRVLLDMLARHKQKEPLNGLILVVAADRLLNCSEEELIEEGRQVRASIIELMEKLEIQLPIYLMITKCDLVDGFTEWCRYLPEKSLLQAMGCLNEELDRTQDVEGLLGRFFDILVERLKQLRLLLMDRTATPSPSILEFPSEINRLCQGLQTFAKTALKENPYQDTPRVRGLYFSSSQQMTGPAHSRQLRDKGIFLHHFFTRVLPGDRGLLRSLPSTERMRRAVRSYATSIGGGLTLLLLVSLTVLFLRDLGELEEIRHNQDPIILQQQDINHRLQSLYRMKSLISRLADAEDQWLVPWTASTEISQQQRLLRNRYRELFETSVLSPIDKGLNNIAGQLRSGETSIMAAGLIRRINLLNGRLKGEGDKLDKLDPIDIDYLLLTGAGLNRESALLFNELYLAYLRWHPSSIDLLEERRSLQTALLHIIERNHGDYRWIIEWANAQAGKPVTLEDFWGGSKTVKDAPVVMPAFTVEGKNFIENFLAELAQASEGAGELDTIKQDFEKYYRLAYIKSWVDFSSRFDLGKQTLRDRKEWLSALEQMASSSNPYFSLMVRMHEELKPFAETQRFPSRRLIDYFVAMQNFSRGESSGDSKLLKKAAKKGLKILSKAGNAGKVAAKAGKQGMKTAKKAKKLHGKSQEELDAVLEQAAKALDAYNKAMAETVFNAESLSQSYGAMKALFNKPDDPSSGDGAPAVAWKAIRTLQGLIGKPTPSTSIFWQLYTGPVKLAYDYMEKEAGCYLQQAWEDNVLAEVEGVEQNRLGNLLIGEQGVVWKYVSEQAGAFLRKRFQKGYLPARVGEYELSWTKPFIQFINAASSGRFIVGNEFTVKIDALPSGVNQGARISPYATFLDLHCANGVQTLANYNYSVSREFNWSLEECGDVNLRIDIGQLRLMRTYKGVKGFSNFLLDFRDGRKVFVPDDFPDQASQLVNEGVRGIDVNYAISGQEPVIKVLDAVPLAPPATVQQCWR